MTLLWVLSASLCIIEIASHDIPIFSRRKNAQMYVHTSLSSAPRGRGKQFVGVTLFLRRASSHCHWQHSSPSLLPILYRLGRGTGKESQKTPCNKVETSNLRILPTCDSWITMLQTQMYRRLVLRVIEFGRIGRERFSTLAVLTDCEPLVLLVHFVHCWWPLQHAPPTVLSQYRA